MNNVLTTKKHAKKVAKKKTVTKVTDRRNKPNRFRLEVSFPLAGKIDYRDTEEKIEKLLRKSCDGAGAGFGQRDLSFYNLTKGRITTMVGLLLNAKIKGLTIGISPDP